MSLASNVLPHTDIAVESAQHYVGSLSTPYKKTANAAKKHKVSQKTGFQETRAHNAEEMQGYFVGPMPVLEFLDAYLPGAQEPTPGLPSLSDGNMESKQEKDTYSDVIQKITESGLIPGFKIIDTSKHPDLCSMKGKRFRPDPSMYRQSVDTDKRPTQFSELELNFEFKRGSGCDPFDDPRDHVGPNSDDIDKNAQADGTAEDPKRDNMAQRRRDLPFESPTAGGKDTRGQLITYATEWFARQHRLFGFTVLIFYPYVRFILWDRSAGVVTERFSLTTHPEHLAEFLWRFVHASDIHRGRDPTVRKATEEEVQLAREHLSEWKDGSEYPVYVFTVPDDGNGREFIGCAWLARPESLTGQATRAYPVYEKATGKTYFLKDSWRAVSTEREADILQELNAAGVRNVPRLICGGDIEDHRTLSHVVGVEEDSDFYDHNTALKRPRWKCGQYFIVERVHHRFVEDFIGRHLDKIQSSRQLLQAAYDAFVGHEDAYVKCRILHRDVSRKNVMMTREGRGILNDWDLAKRIVDPPAVEMPRTPHRTGTWQFISAMLLIHPGKRHVVQDDIESFIYVVLYHALRYLSHTAVPRARTIFHKLFDESDEGEGGMDEGGSGKNLFFKNDAPIVGLNFCFDESAPLQEWYKSAYFAVGQWHAYEERLVKDMASANGQPLPEENEDPFFSAPTPAPIPLERLIFADHKRLRQKWESILARSDWPDEENVVDHTPERSRRPQPKPVADVELGSRLGSFMSSASVLAKRSPEEVQEECSQTVKKSRMSSHHIPESGRVKGEGKTSSHHRLP